MAPLLPESIELPKNECSLSESFGGPQFPLPQLPVSERAIAVRETTYSIGSDHRSTPLTHTREAQDDFPEGGYGWVVVLASSVIRYAILATMSLSVYMFLRHHYRCQFFLRRLDVLLGRRASSIDTITAC